MESCYLAASLILSLFVTMKTSLYALYYCPWSTLIIKIEKVNIASYKKLQLFGKNVKCLSGMSFPSSCLLNVFLSQQNSVNKFFPNVSRLIKF